MEENEEIHLPHQSNEYSIVSVLISTVPPLACRHQNNYMNYGCDLFLDRAVTIQVEFDSASDLDERSVTLHVNQGSLSLKILWNNSNNPGTQIECCVLNFTSGSLHAFTIENRFIIDINMNFNFSQ